MEFESVIKMRFPYIAAVIYDENPTVHPSLTNDVSCLHNLHHNPNQMNLDRSLLPPVQPHTYEMSSKETFRSIMPTPCNEGFETYFHGIPNNHALMDLAAYTTTPTVGSNVFHVSHENAMWEHNQNQGYVLETESSFNLAMATQIKKNRRLMRRICKSMKKPIIIKGQWTSHEDKLLVKLVEEHGTKSWSHIAKMLHGRVGKQCRERWHNHLRPDIKKDEWTEEEDKILIETHKVIGNKWAEIARRLPGRTENTIKNHWNATKRRQHSRRAKGKDDVFLPRGSNTLQDYIRSLTYNEDTTLMIATPNANAITAGPGYVRDKGKSIIVDEVSGYDKNHYEEEKCKFLVDGVMNMNLNNGTQHAPPMEFKSAICASGPASTSASASAIASKYGETMEHFDEPMTDSWMVMHGCDEVMMKEIALLELITHGGL